MVYKAQPVQDSVFPYSRRTLSQAFQVLIIRIEGPPGGAGFRGTGTKTPPKVTKDIETRIDSLKKEIKDLEEQSKLLKQDNVLSNEGAQLTDATMQEGIQLRTDNYNSQIQLWETYLVNTIKRTWKSRHGSRYKRGNFLIVRWKCGDLKLDDEVKRFEKALLLFNIVAEEFLIPDENSEAALEDKVLAWLKQDNSPDMLKGFVYSGHGRFGDSLDSCWTPTEKSTLSVSSGFIQQHLERSVSDVLIIYDACQSADFPKSTKVSGGVKELIAACCFSSDTSDEEEDSFTISLINALKKGHEMGVPVSISTLVLWILEEKETNWLEEAETSESEESESEESGIEQSGSEDSEIPDQATEAGSSYHKAPVHTKLSSESSDRGIILHPIEMEHRRTIPKLPVEQEPENDISLTFGTSALDTKNINAWAEWTRTAPPNVMEFQGLKVTTARPKGSRK
ncbi:hypothetical protein DL98DRAFT_71729 [Cadophora sp. DSE1049]|nr:hypothetical protein DL98DRAFT_71729 [Cadophora sp. DSE1049]